MPPSVLNPGHRYKYPENRTKPQYQRWIAKCLARRSLTKLAAVFNCETEGQQTSIRSKNSPSIYDSPEIKLIKLPPWNSTPTILSNGLVSRDTDYSSSEIKLIPVRNRRRKYGTRPRGPISTKHGFLNTFYCNV
jgi:hypothetical protein